VLYRLDEESAATSSAGVISAKATFIYSAGIPVGINSTHRLVSLL
jgi:hypothetical protein